MDKLLWVKKSEPLLIAYFPLTDHIVGWSRERKGGGRGRERKWQAINFPCVCVVVVEKTAISSFFLTFHSRLCTDCHCTAWITPQGYELSFGLWVLFAGQDNYKAEQCPYQLFFSMWCQSTWFISLLEERTDRIRWDRKKIHLSWMNVLRIPKCAYTLTCLHCIHTHSHTQPRVLWCSFPFLSLHRTIIYSISFFSVTRSVSHAITHRQLPGESPLL